MKWEAGYISSLAGCCGRIERAVSLAGWRDLRLQAPRSRNAEQSALLRVNPREGTTPWHGVWKWVGQVSVNLRFVGRKEIDLLMDFEIGHPGPIMQMLTLAHPCPSSSLALIHPFIHAATYPSHPSLHSCSYLSHKHFRHFCVLRWDSTECGVGPHEVSLNLYWGKRPKQIARLPLQSSR